MEPCDCESMNNYNKLVLSNALFNCSRTFIGGFIIASLMTSNIPLAVISLAKACQLLISVFFTIPAAKLSRKIGNKYCVLIGCLFAFAYYLFLMFPSNNNVIAGEIFNGLSLAFYCGSYESWLFNCSNNAGKQESYTSFAFSQELSYLMMALSGLLGGLFSEHALQISVLIIIIGFIIALTCKETVTSTITVTKNKLSTFSLKFPNRDSFYLFLILIISYGLMQSVYQYWQPFFKELNSSLGYSYLSSVFFLFMITQSIYSKITRSYCSNSNLQISIQFLISSIILLILAEKIIFNIYIITFLFVTFMALSASSLNYVFSQINNFIKKEEQSIFISHIEAWSRFGGFIVLILYSYLQTISIELLWLVLGLNFLFISVFILMYRNEVFVNELQQ